VSRRTSVFASGSTGAVDQLRQAEVQDLDDAVVADHHVLGLDVAMDNAGFVRGVEGGGHLEGDLQGVSQRQRHGAHPLAQRLSPDELRGNEVQVLEIPDLVDGEDIGVIERRRRLRFPHESTEAIAVSRRFPVQDLQGHLALEARVLGDVDRAHAARAQRRQDLVGSEVNARRERHWSSGGFVDSTPARSLFEETERVVPPRPLGAGRARDTRARTVLPTSEPGLGASRSVGTARTRASRVGAKRAGAPPSAATEARHPTHQGSALKRKSSKRISRGG